MNDEDLVRPCNMVWAFVLWAFVLVGFCPSGLLSVLPVHSADQDQNVRVRVSNHGQHCLPIKFSR